MLPHEPKTSVDSTRCQARFLECIRKMEVDFERLKANPKVSQNYIADRDALINDLIAAFNQLQRTNQHYQIINDHLQFQNDIMNQMLAAKMNSFNDFIDFHYSKPDDTN